MSTTRPSRVVPALLCLLLAPATAFAQTGGPDAFGYTYAPTTYAFSSISGTGVNTNLADDASATVAMGFTFPFYGVNYTSVRIGDNGGVSFGSAGLGYTNGCLPTAGSSPDIAVFWDDLIYGNTYYKTNGSSGPFIVSWESRAHYSYTSGTVTFQLKLYPSGRIEMHYYDVYFGSSTYDYGVSATVGIQAATQGLSSTYNLPRSCNSAVLSAGTAVAFTACTDMDGDGFTPVSCGGTDCNDANAAVRPGAT